MALRRQRGHGRKITEKGAGSLVLGSSDLAFADCWQLNKVVFFSLTLIHFDNGYKVKKREMWGNVSKYKMPEDRVIIYMCTCKLTMCNVR